MSVSINTNYAATAASNNLALSNSMLQRSLNRLSSGSRIVSPADDAGGTAVAMRLSATAKRSGSAATNINNAVSLLQNQDGALKVGGKILERMAELQSLWNDATKNSDDKALYDIEFTTLQDQLQSLSEEKFNGVAIFATSPTSIITSADGEQNLEISAKNLGGDNFGLLITATSLGDLTLTVGTTSTSVNEVIEGAQNEIAGFRAHNGAEQNGLNFAAELLTLNKANLEAATGRIVDVDVADESTQLAKWTTLTQAGTAMLAQANQANSLVLKLIGQ
jgi:flagellin